MPEEESLAENLVKVSNLNMKITVEKRIVVSDQEKKNAHMSLQLPGSFI